MQQPLQELKEKLRLFPRVIVELGMGDGALLESLASKDARTLFVGIERDVGQCKEARSRIVLPNAFIVNSSFEEVLPTLPDAGIDRFISILPHPAYIDEGRSQIWMPLYKVVFEKLKVGGTFQVITEVTDELLRPVSQSQYAKYSKKLASAFSSLGFSLANSYEGSPAEYSSRCLELFRGDSQRIRLITLDMFKK